jgi:thiamine biosynthesis lipoprotein
VDRAGWVTVIGPSLMRADVWATALFVGQASLAARFASASQGYRAIHL